MSAGKCLKLFACSGLTKLSKLIFGNMVYCSHTHTCIWWKFLLSINDFKRVLCILHLLIKSLVQHISQPPPLFACSANSNANKKSNIPRSCHAHFVKLKYLVFGTHISSECGCVCVYVCLHSAFVCRIGLECYMLRDNWQCHFQFLWFHFN